MGPEGLKLGSTSSPLSTPHCWGIETFVRTNFLEVTAPLKLLD